MESGRHERIDRVESRENRGIKGGDIFSSRSCTRRARLPPPPFPDKRHADMGNVLDTLRGLVDGLVVRAYPYLHGHRDDPDELYRGYTNREAYEQFLADVDREIRLRAEKGH
eukprot:jgi/Mesvir1/4973/Mv24255-RA.1